MLRFALSRLALVVPTLVGITMVAFFLIRLVPGDPIEAMAGERGIDPVRHAELQKLYGLDRPLWEQYGVYVARLAHGDLGKSISTSEPVVAEFATLFPATLELYRAGRLPLDRLVSHRLPLDEVARGFELMRDGTALRVVLDLTS